MREDSDVERLPVHIYVGGRVRPRREGDTLVVEKRLVLKGDIRINRRRTEGHGPRRVTLRG